MSNKDFNPFTGKIQESEGVENNSFFYRFWDNLKKNKITLVCLFLLGIIIFLSVFIFFIALRSGQGIFSEKYMPSGKSHIWGTDAMGRDYFTRAFYGGRVSLSIGLFSMIIATIWGTIYGTICGYMGGKIDAFLMRGVDIFMSIPSFILIVVISSYMSPSVPVIIFIIALFSWMGVARIVRAGTMSLKERDFVMASCGSRCIRKVDCCSTHNSGYAARNYCVSNCQCCTCYFNRVSFKFSWIWRATANCFMGKYVTDCSERCIDQPHACIVPRNVDIDYCFKFSFAWRYIT